LLSVCAGIGLSKFQQPIPQQTLKNYQKPLAVKKEEPLAKQFSMEMAGHALDSASLDWQVKNKCFTCHTNVPYLYGRHLIGVNDPAAQDIRKALEENVQKSIDTKRPLQNFYAVSAATALAINDSITTKKLHPLTKHAMDHMWTVQQKGGRMPWGGGGPPIGSDHFGAAITAVAVAVAPEEYAKTEAGQQGLQRVRDWLKANQPTNYYDKAMVVWAASLVEGILTEEQKSTYIKELVAKQLPDGSWSLPTFGDGKQAMKKGAPQVEQNPVGDGYATGLTVYALRQAGLPANDPVVAKGVTWLKTHQLESGRWPTQSLSSSVGNVLTNTASVFVVMALHSCGEMGK